MPSRRRGREPPRPKSRGPRFFAPPVRLKGPVPPSTKGKGPGFPRKKVALISNKPKTRTKTRIVRQPTKPASFQSLPKKKNCFPDQAEHCEKNEENAMWLICGHRRAVIKIVHRDKGKKEGARNENTSRGGENPETAKRPQR